MLIYGSNFNFEPEGGPQKIVDCVARWAGNRANRSSVDSTILSQGVRELRLKDGSVLSSRVTPNDGNQPTYPYYFCAQLSHGDDKVSGRRWMTEVGVRQDSETAQIFCSVLLKTDEVSARVNTSIQVTRPKVVEQLMQQCQTIGFTPGLKVKRLDQDSAAAFLWEIEREDRYWPIVIISSAPDGTFAVAPERMRSLLVGIADVVEVTREVDTFKVEETLGARYGAWGGAVNIVFLARKGDRTKFCDTLRFLPKDLIEITENGRRVEAEILTAVTHRTNLPFSWRHISLEMVSQATFRSQLSKSISRAKLDDETAEYVELLETADSELRTKDEEIVGLRGDIEERDGQVDKLQAEIEGLKHALSGRQSSTNANEGDLSALLPLRGLVEGVITDDLSLEHSLNLISILFSNRVVVLDSAQAAARDSDADNFKYGKKALDLLWKLANGYWQALADGRGDQHAKSAIGNNAYAQNEGEALTTEGKRRRTFSYRGRDFFMQKHLKIGVKDSSTETLRVHFEWLADEKRLVIGHCGKHLDF
jgi:hypothetical protein